jgi:hypothetical protein
MERTGSGPQHGGQAHTLRARPRSCVVARICSKRFDPPFCHPVFAGVVGSSGLTLCRVRRVPLELTIDDYEARLAVAGRERVERWRTMPEDERLHYVKRLQDFGGDPPELLDLLRDPDNREAWGFVPWIVQREYCLWINSGAIALIRERRARVAIRDAPAASLRRR